VALKKLLDYCRADEETHFNECMDVLKERDDLGFLRNEDDKKELIKTHIYPKIQLLDAFVERWEWNDE